LIPSPTIAIQPPAHEGSLLVGKHLGVHLADACLRAMRRAARSLSPVAAWSGRFSTLECRRDCRTLPDRKPLRAMDDSLSGPELNLQNGPTFIDVLDWGTNDKEILIQDLIPNAGEVRTTAAHGIACLQELACLIVELCFLHALRAHFSVTICLLWTERIR
jgi:hypothetical protein